MSVNTLPVLEQEQWPMPWDPPVQGWAAVELSYPNVTDFADHFAMYNRMVVWIKQNVENYQSNALWTKIGDCIYVKLRKEKDAMMFILCFGAPQQ